MTCALLVVALAGWMQWLSLSLGDAPKAAIEKPEAGLSPLQSPVMVAGYDLSPWPATPTYSPPTLFPTPTLAPPVAVVEAATRVQQQGGQITEDEMRLVLAAAGWPESEFSNALAVSWCESKWSPYAHNGGNAGLFQMNVTEAATIRGSWFAYWGLPEDGWSDPVTNAKAALWTWERSGWAPWSCAP